MTSDWKDRANKRRDERHTKSPDDSPKPKAAKKDTKSFCRGKEGVEHTPKCFKVRDNWWELCCTTCGRKLDWYYRNSSIRLTDGTLYPFMLQPAWVVEDE